MKENRVAPAVVGCLDSLVAINLDAEAPRCIREEVNLQGLCDVQNSFEAQVLLIPNGHGYRIRNVKSDVLELHGWFLGVGGLLGFTIAACGGCYPRICGFLNRTVNRKTFFSWA